VTLDETDKNAREKQLLRATWQNGGAVLDSAMRTNAGVDDSHNTCSRQQQHSALDGRSLSLTCRLLDATVRRVSMTLHCEPRAVRPRVSLTPSVCRDRKAPTDREPPPIDKRQFNFLVDTRRPLAFDVIILLPHTADYASHFIPG